jgi:pimeloyl-ACP methyl ester carboxylesterase
MVAISSIITLHFIKISMFHNKLNAWIAIFGYTALVGCSPLPTLPNSSQVNFDGSQVYAAHSKGNSPTVVFQSGFGVDISAWSEVLKRLPSDIATFAYDRPGTGGSPNKSGERDPCTIARELHELLRVADVRPPYILVGHSLGGIYQYAFAKLYPKEVKGILLVDATHPDFPENLQRVSPNYVTTAKALQAAISSETQKRELNYEKFACLSELKLISTPAIPTRQLIRGVHPFIHTAELQAMSNELDLRWSELLPGLTASRIEGAGHFIQLDKPDLVAAEVSSLVSAARANK